MLFFLLIFFFFMMKQSILIFLSLIFYIKSQSIMSHVFTYCSH